MIELEFINVDFNDVIVLVICTLHALTNFEV